MLHGYDGCTLCRGGKADAGGVGYKGRTVSEKVRGGVGSGWEIGSEGVSMRRNQ